MGETRPIFYTQLYRSVAAHAALHPLRGRVRMMYLVLNLRILGNSARLRSHGVDNRSPTIRFAHIGTVMDIPSPKKTTRAIIIIKLAITSIASLKSAAPLFLCIAGLQVSMRTPCCSMKACSSPPLSFPIESIEAQPNPILPKIA